LIGLGADISTNDITLPALNITRHDDANEALEKVKARSRSVLKKQGFHKFNRPKVNVSDLNVDKKNSDIKRRNRYGTDDRMSNSDSVNPESPMPEVKLPSINSNKKQLYTTPSFHDNYEKQESNYNLVSNKVLSNLKHESEQLLEKVRNEYSRQEESSMHDMSYSSIPVMKKQSNSVKPSLHLDNEEKAKIMKSIIIDPNNDDLDFESSVSSKFSKHNRSRQTKLRKDMTLTTDKNILNNINSSTKKIDDIFAKPKEIKIKKMKDYFKKQEKPVKLNPDTPKRSFK
jgi:hypothetical protein